MQLFRTLQDVKTGPTACAIGMFDGLHLGHQMVLEQAIRQAKIQNLTPVVFTFANHPQSVVSQTPTPLLSTLEERLEAIAEMGFKAVLVLDFTPELKDITATDFVKTILLDTLQVKAVSIGYDHRFGKDRKGDGAFLHEMGQQYGFMADIVPPVKVGNQIVSSTLVRKLLSYGDLEKANQLLGRPYTISGQVVIGDGRGRTLGFPTANLTLPLGRLVPANGVYAGLASIEGVAEAQPAVCNIGYAPTFGEHPVARMEVHVLGDPGDLYGKSLTFSFLHYLRQEQTFPSAQELVSQLHADCEQARSLVGLSGE